MYKRILAGSDGSKTAAVAVDRAAQVAALAGSPLTLLCVDREERASKVVAAEAARLADTGVEVRTQIEEGDPASVLIEVAEAGGYDLLVVGNKGMTGLSRFFLGSVPNKVSHHVEVSLLIVRTT